MTPCACKCLTGPEILPPLSSIPSPPSSSQVLIAQDPKCVDMPDAAGDTGLHEAANAGNLDILRYLLTLKPESLNMQNLDRR